EPPRSRGARPRPGAHRVPPHLLQRPPADRPRAARLGRPGRGVHGRLPARDGGGGAPLLPARPVADRHEVAGGAARRVAALGPRRAPGLVHHRRHDPDRDPRPALRAPDRHRRPQPVAHRVGPHRLRPDPALRGPHGQPRPRPRRPLGARRRADRPGAVARARAGRLALRRHHDRRAPAGPRAGGRRAVLLPARDPRGGRLRAVQAARRHRRGGRRRGGLRGRRAGHARVVRRRLRGHRVAAALPRDALPGRLRRLPSGARCARSGTRRRRRDCL
ncbi:MAG: Undecaprenyl-diphosphatase, partial [uncultured Solirubrobacteraceae bacterium]